MTTSAEAFVKDLMLNIRANHPVTIIYTNDPNETLQLVKESSKTVRDRTDKLFYWNSRHKWIDISAADKKLAEQIANPIEVSLNQKQGKTPLQFTFSSPEELKCKAPVFIMSMVSSSFKDEVIGPLQELRDFDYLVRNGVNESYRIIIIANNSFNIPSDYENIFGVVKHQPPSKEELTTIYDEFFMEEFVEKVVVPVYDGDVKQLKAKFEELKPYCINTLNGLSGRQAKLILFKALSHSVEKVNKTVVKAVDYEKFKNFIYEKKFEEISRGGIVQVLKPVPIQDVGGLDVLKDWTQERAWAFSEEAKALKVRRPKGMALIGPPGTGKTLMARAVASIMNFPCLKLDVSSVFNKWVGDSEKNMTATLETIEQMAPCVVFVDEIDKVFAGQAGGGSGGDSGTTTRVMGKLLSWMQDCPKDVFFVVTANRVHNIPSELLRHGRLDEKWCVTFPTRKEREDVLRINLRKSNYEIKDLSKVLDNTEDFSSAELEHVVNESILKAGFKKQKLSQDHLLTEIRNITPSSVAFKDDIASMKEWAHKHARMASSPEVKAKETESPKEI
jgi:SpoVK/Ycf46/Vps4 family AAA+-type ATPase